MSMSETSDRPEQTRARAQAARAAMREATQRGEEIIHSATEASNEMAQSAAETASHTTDAAVDITQRVADQGREVVWLGMRAAAGMNGRLAEVGYGTSHRALEQAARAMEIYGQATERTTERLQSLFSCWLTLGRGAQQLHHAWLNVLDRSVNEAVRKPQDLFRCKSLAEVADTQRDLYVGAIDRAFEASTALLQATERMARDAQTPLQRRTQVAGQD
jgi:Phasin protein